MEATEYARKKAMVTVMRFLYLSIFATSMRKVESNVDEVLAIPSRQSGRTIKVHRYGPRSDGNTKSGPHPVLINYHGSGFVLPAHGEDQDFCRHIVQETPYLVLDASYRLGPEHPFPAATDDAEDVVKYVLSRPDEYDATRIAVSGFSAGGCLALVVSGHTFPKETFRSVVAFYPVTNIAKDPSKKVAPDPSGRSIPAFMANLFNDSYVPDQNQRKNPLVSPEFIKEDRFPNNILMVTCAQDSLAAEAEELAERVKKLEGTNVVISRMEGCRHGWDKATHPPGSQQAERKSQAYGLAVEMLMK